MFFSEDDSALMVECNRGNGGVLQYDLATGDVKRLTPLPELEKSGLMKLSPDRRWLVGMSGDFRGRELRAFDVENGNQLATSTTFKTPDPYMIDHEMPS